ncbi:MAG: hypothetical protein ABIH03_06565 [Pseudomonadota bacterium]
MKIKTGLQCGGLVFVREDKKIFSSAELGNTGGAQYVLTYSEAVTLITGHGPFGTWIDLNEMGLARVTVEHTGTGNRVASMLRKENTGPGAIAADKEARK